MAENTNAAENTFEDSIIDERTVENSVQVDDAPKSLVDMIKESRLYNSHPECKTDTEKTIDTLSTRIADDTIDPNHRTHPYLTKYERTAVIELRASQIQKGLPPFISVPPHIHDAYEIAKIELLQRKLPYIINRTLPDGTHEYWRIRDFTGGFSD